jgi:putative pyruvate formate lyase activating enzyme
MLRQVGHLQLDGEGIAQQGLIVRHLVLPEGIAGSRETLIWIAEYLGTDTHIALMNQYFPAHRAVTLKQINRKVSEDEYAAVVDALEECGLEHGWVQD